MHSRSERRVPKWPDWSEVEDFETAETPPRPTLRSVPMDWEAEEKYGPVICTVQTDTGWRSECGTCADKWIVRSASDSEARGEVTRHLAWHKSFDND